MESSNPGPKFDLLSARPLPMLAAEPAERGRRRPTQPLLLTARSAIAILWCFEFALAGSLAGSEPKVHTKSLRSGLKLYTTVTNRLLMRNRIDPDSCG